MTCDDGGDDDNVKGLIRKRRRWSARTLNVVTYKTKTDTSLVHAVILQLGWKISHVVSESDIILYGPPYSLNLQCDADYPRLKETQRANRLAGAGEMCKKCELALLLQAWCTVFPPSARNYTREWCVPSQWRIFRKKAQRNRLYILKPSQGSCGEGIKIFYGTPKKLNDILHHEVMHFPTATDLGGQQRQRGAAAVRTACSMAKDVRNSAQGPSIMSAKTKTKTDNHFVVSEYICRPFLVDGLKFDIRLYVLVCGTLPGSLRVYLFREGLARFCTQPYEVDRTISDGGDFKYDGSDSMMNDMFMHLSNFSLNSRSKGYVDAVPFPGKEATNWEEGDGESDKAGEKGKQEREGKRRFTPEYDDRRATKRRLSTLFQTLRAQV